MSEQDFNKVSNQMSIYKTYLDNDKKNVWKGSTYKFNVMDFSKHSPELADILIEEPGEQIKVIYLTLAEYDLYKTKKITVQFVNIPKIQDRRINRLRTKNFNELVSIMGVVMSRTHVFGHVLTSQYECPSCGNIFNILQRDDTLKQPSACGCGRKGKFDLVDHEIEDVLNIQLEELPENLKGSEIGYNIKCVLKDPFIIEDYNIFLGARVELIGYLTKVFKRKNKQTVNQCDYILNVLGYKNLEDIQFSTKTSKKEKELFTFISESKNPAKLISNWIYPDIKGYTKAKELCIFQQFSGVKNAGKRDFLHILLYGDPGTSKTDICKRAIALNPIHQETSGPEVTGVGLVGATIKDELTGQYMIRGGLLPRCNSGVAFVDEIEKMSDSHKNSLHTPMESGQVTINKGGISAKVVTNTAILATSNEKVVEKDEKVVDLPTPIIDRFDFLLHFKDRIDTTSDKEIASFITERAIFDKESTTFNQVGTTFEALDTTFYIVSLVKYIYICKKRRVKLSRRVKNILLLWYSELRQASTSCGWGIKIPTPRAVESILRLSRAICRSKLKDTITVIELKLAIKYFDFMYQTKTHKKAEIVEV